MFESGGAEGLLGTYLCLRHVVGLFDTCRCLRQVVGLFGTYRCLRQVLGVTWYLHVLEAGVGGYLVPTGV